MRIAFLCALLVASVATAQVIVIPNGTGTTEGNSSNGFPWGRTGLGIRQQSVYDSTHFTSQGITTPVLITRLRWRPNTGYASLASNNPAGATISLSTCPLDQAAVTTTFANNQGANLRQVFEGPVSWPANAAVTGPCPFLIDIPLQHNFVYDPAAGDLNIETDIPIQAFTGSAINLDVQTAGSLSSRMVLTAGYANGAANATGTVTTNHGVVVEVTCVTTGLFADFRASTRTGATPLLVNFTDQTFTSAAGITSWAWDFDGDTVVDSTLQNPTFTYTSCGSYTVSLTVTDGTNPPSTKTLANHVVTDNVTADFTTGPAGINLVQFTDTTTPVPTSWLWDLDGDALPDSTQQNPTWTYPGGCSPPVNVTLTVSRLCRGSFTVTKPVRVATTLPTLSNGGSSFGIGGGNYLDVNVTNALGISVCAIDTKTTATLSTPVTIEIYRAATTYVGKELNASAWQMIATGTGTGVGSGIGFPPVPITLSNRFHLPFGSHGMFIRIATGGGPMYLTGNNVFSNADLTLTVGASQLNPFVSVVAASRTWNGAFHYTTTASSGTAGYGTFGAGCPGTMPVSRLTALSPPQLGQLLTLTVDNLPVAGAFLIYGFSRTASVFGPLPMDLTPLGAPGCFGRVSVDAANFLLGAGSSVSSGFFLPNNPALMAAQFYNQALVIDPSFNGLGAVISEAAAAIVGNN